MDHAGQDQVAEFTRFRRDLTRNDGVDLFGCSRWGGASEGGLRVRQAPLLVLDHADDVPTLAAELRLQVCHHLLETSVKNSYRDVRAVGGR
eukprot:6595551-Pyramimonas_sp.AAC.1